MRAGGRREAGGEGAGCRSHEKAGEEYSKKNLVFS